MRPKTILLLVVAIGCGLTAAFAVNQLARTEPADLADVLVPRTDIHAGSKLNVKQMFVIRRMPRALVAPNVITDPEKLDGKVLARTVSANLPLTQRDLLQPSHMVSMMDPGYRAMTVRANIESGLAGFLMPGARVDLLTVAREAEGTARPESRIFLQNIKVLAVNTLTEPPENKGNLAVPTSITLMLRPEQTQRLFLVKSGSLGIVLRRPGDNERILLTPALDPFGKDGPAEQSEVLVPVALQSIEEGKLIDRFDDYFRLLPFQEAQLVGQPVLNRGDIEGQRLTRFIAKGQPAMQENFLLGVVAHAKIHEMVIQDGLKTTVHKFSISVAPPPKPLEDGSEVK